MPTPTGRQYLGVYDRPAPAGSAINSKQASPDVTPFGIYNEGVRKSLRLARWLTAAHDHLEELFA